ncbi:hypothetical protein IWX49DRAFT_170925 [Phyllosticta citricarpa]|uniref:Uncharacterized protein n=1 Tax=Phyllosticta citricarpa TaxID=55181 RepID=A0ABR1M2S3_9PEZI
MSSFVSTLCIVDCPYFIPSHVASRSIRCVGSCVGWTGCSACMTGGWSGAFRARMAHILGNKTPHYYPTGGYMDMWPQDHTHTHTHTRNAVDTTRRDIFHKSTVSLITHSRRHVVAIRMRQRQTLSRFSLCPIFLIQRFTQSKQAKELRCLPRWRHAGCVVAQVLSLRVVMGAWSKGVVCASALWRRFGCYVPLAEILCQPRTWYPTTFDLKIRLTTNWTGR